MTTKVTLTPKRKYTFDEIGEFVFAQSWENSKDIGINIHLVKIMMNSFDAERDSETDKYKMVIIQGVFNLNLIGKEVREFYNSVEKIEK